MTSEKARPRREMPAAAVADFDQERAAFDQLVPPSKHEAPDPDDVPEDEASTPTE